MSRKIDWRDAADWSKDELEENVAYLESRGMTFEADQARRVAGGDISTDAGDDRPNVSDKKDMWVAFRKSQGYSDEDLEDLTKEDLIDLDDK